MRRKDKSGKKTTKTMKKSKSPHRRHHSRDAKHQRRRRKEKVTVSFDDDARTEYLTGFRKRKQERRKNAKRARDTLSKNQRKEERDERGAGPGGGL